MGASSRTAMGAALGDARRWGRERPPGDRRGRATAAPRRRAGCALAGVLTGAAGLAVSLAVAALLRRAADPGRRGRRGGHRPTPGKVAQELVDIVGRWDKPLLLAGVLVGSWSCSAARRAADRAQPLRGQLVFLAMAVLAAAAVLTRPQAPRRPSGAGRRRRRHLVGGAAVPHRSAQISARRDACRCRPDGAEPDGTGARRAFLRRAGAGGARRAGRRGRQPASWAASGAIVEAARARLRPARDRRRRAAGAAARPRGLDPWRVAERGLLPDRHRRRRARGRRRRVAAADPRHGGERARR